MVGDLFQKLLLSEAEFGQIAEELASAYPGLIHLSDIGKSQEGRPIRLFTVTEFSSGEDKPGFFVQGHIHSKEMSGSLAGLDLVRRLAKEYTPGGILSKAVFYVIPRCNPDGAERMVQHPGDERSSWGDYTGVPNGIERCDIDGDGLSKTMLVEDPEGALCFSERHPRCLVSRTADSKGPFFHHMPEGMLHNFDRKTLGNWPPFAREYLDWNRNWSVGWSAAQYGSGSAPLSVPEVKLQADWLKAHPNIQGAVAFHNGYGSLMFPAVKAEDQAYVEALGSRGEKLVGYPALYGAVQAKSDSQIPAAGTFSDYCYGELGILGITIELGTRENSAGADSRELFQRPDAYTAAWEVVEQQDADPSLPTCVFEWKEFTHPQLGKVLLGGSCPVLFASPLLDYLAKVSEGVCKFIQSFVEDLLQNKGIGR